MVRVSGNIALANAPSHGGAWLQLSIYLFPWSLAETRRRLSGAREGVEVVEISAPIDAPRLLVALDRRSLYLLGLKAEAAENWWAFEENGALPRLPGGGSRRINGRSDYTFLGLNKIETTPVKLLSDLCVFDGRLGDQAARDRMALLIFLTAEALRFDSIMLAGMRFLGGGRIDLGDYADTLKNWKNATARGARDVLVPHLPG